MQIRIILQASEDCISQGIMWRTLDGEVMQHTQKCICKALVYVSLEWIHILKILWLFSFYPCILHIDLCLILHAEGEESVYKAILPHTPEE